MKLNGIVGKGSGKLGASVFAISGGEQIVRQYNPQVANPNTDAQVAQRAKLKLMSQLAAALAPAIAFKKQGLVSARNQFVSKNIGNAVFENNEASIDLVTLDVTGGKMGLPALADDMGLLGKIALSLVSPASSEIKRVAYFVFKEDEANNLSFVAEKLVTDPGANNQFEGEITVEGGKHLVLAYGIKDVSEKATTRFNEYEVNTAGDKGVLGVLQSLSVTDVTLSFTQGKIVSVEG